MRGVVGFFLGKLAREGMTLALLLQPRRRDDGADGLPKKAGRLTVLKEACSSWLDG